MNAIVVQQIFLELKIHIVIDLQWNHQCETIKLRTCEFFK